MTDGRSFVTNEIKAAFLDLMREKSYMDITVSDVVKRAKIARMSFYRKFKSVSDVLDSVSEDAFSKFSENALPAFNGNDPKVLREFLFSFLYFFKNDNAKYFFVRKDNVDVLFSKFYERMAETEQKIPALSLEEKYAGIAKFGFVDGTLHKWIATGMTEPPEELVGFMMKYLQTMSPPVV